MLGRGWGSPTDWPGINPRNNGKDRPDQAKDASAQDRQKATLIEARKPMESKLETEVSSRSHLGKELLELPQELSRVHHTFHVSNLKKCYADEPLVMPLEGIHVDDKLQFMEEPIEIIEQEIKR
ncbi:hypothetical protein Tco_0265090 [Tanacetum coccineum]